MDEIDGRTKRKGSVEHSKGVEDLIAEVSPRSLEGVREWLDRCEACGIDVTREGAIIKEEGGIPSVVVGRCIRAVADAAANAMFENAIQAAWEIDDSVIRDETLERICKSVGWKYDWEAQVILREHSPR